MNKEKELHLLKMLFVIIFCFIWSEGKQSFRDEYP